MWYYKEKNEMGMYVDSDNERYMLASASAVITHEGQTPESLGWYEFESEEACLEAWRLKECTKYNAQSPRGLEG